MWEFACEKKNELHIEMYLARKGKIKRDMIK